MNLTQLLAAATDSVLVLIEVSVEVTPKIVHIAVSRNDTQCRSGANVFHGLGHGKEMVLFVFVQFVEYLLA